MAVIHLGRLGAWRPGYCSASALGRGFGFLVDAARRRRQHPMGAHRAPILGHRLIVKALLLTLVGSIALTVIDNVVRPLSVGRETHLPGYLVLISTLGGVAVFGLNGVVIGPVVASMFVATWACMVRQRVQDLNSPCDSLSSELRYAQQPNAPESRAILAVRSGGTGRQRQRPTVVRGGLKVETRRLSATTPAQCLFSLARIPRPPKTGSISSPPPRPSPCLSATASSVPGVNYLELTASIILSGAVGA